MDTTATTRSGRRESGQLTPARVGSGRPEPGPREKSRRLRPGRPEPGPARPEPRGLRPGRAGPGPREPARVRPRPDHGPRPGPRRPRPGQPEPGPRRAGARETARQSLPSVISRRSSRTRFVLLLVGLLGGGLVCLLVINTTLAAGSFQISRLQQGNAAAAQRMAQLQQQVATDQSPATIEQRAARLGLRMQPVLNFVDLRDGRRYTTAARLPNQYDVPGYTP